MHSLFGKNRGFTLIELLIAASILAIVMSIAVPSFAQMMRRNRLATNVNEFVTVLNAARSEAHKQGLPVSVCAANAALTACASDWGTAWLTFTDVNSNGAVDGTDSILRKTPTPAGGISFTPATSGQAHVNFRPMGATQTLDMTIKKTGCTGPEKRQVSVALTGRISLVKQDCP